jgi:hypothetical protein
VTGVTAADDDGFASGPAGLVFFQNIHFGGGFIALSRFFSAFSLI